MTAMDTVHDQDLETSRLEDGMLNLRELSRTLVEALVNEIMSAQADMLCEDDNTRNGYRELSNTATGYHLSA